MQRKKKRSSSSPERPAPKRKKKTITTELFETKSSKKTSDERKIKAIRPTGNRNIQHTFNPQTWDEMEAQGLPPTLPHDLPDANVLKEYPPPSTNPIFVSHWATAIPSITARENFKKPHLQQLSVLCDLYVEYESLRNRLARIGYTYKSMGRNGAQYKVHPEVAQLNRCRSEIRSYAKILGLLLFKDSETGDPGSEEAKSEWE